MTWIIRKEQMKAFEQYIFETFIDKMLTILRELYPAQCSESEEVAVRDAIKAGVVRAEAHGFTSEYDIGRFIILQYMLGQDFDTDPQYPWVSDILGNSALPLTSRLGMLWSKAQLESAKMSAESLK